MDYQAIYNAAYQLLKRNTPLKTDCGKLCNQACCQDSNADLGMYLFPGEDSILQEANFLKIEPTGLEYKPGKKVLFASCNGKCERSLRPLACRIFPLTPYLTGKEIMIIKMDPRSLTMCPIARNLKRSELNPEFVHDVRRACHELIRYEEIKLYINWLSEIIDDFEHFKNG